MTVFCGYVSFLVFLFFIKIPQVVSDVLLQINKRKSFLGRYQLWKRIIVWINNKLILGHGYMPGSEFLLYTKKWWATHAHNWALNIMFMGGVTLFLIFAFAVLTSARSLNRYNENICSMILTATLITYFLMGVDEAMTNSPMVYPIFILAMYIDKIVELFREVKYTKSFFGLLYTFVR